MIFVSVEKDEVSPFLQVLAERASDFTEPISRVLASGLEDASATIRGGGPDFGWAGHSPWTRRVDEILGRSRVGMGWEDGKLMDSLVPRGPGNVFEVSATEGEAGTAVTNSRTGYAYGKGFQEGRDKSFKFVQYVQSKGRIHEFNARAVPPRPFLYWHEEEFPEYDRIFADHLMGEAA